MYGPVKVPVSNRMIDGHRIAELGVLQHLRQVDCTFAHHVLRWMHIAHGLGHVFSFDCTKLV